MAERDRVSRFDRWVRRSPVVLLLVLGAFLLGTATTLTGAGRSAWNWVSHDVNWRDDEYQKLQSLRAGFTLEKFEQELGAPVFRRRSSDRLLVESTFQGRDYWVQTVSTAKNGAVLLYAVTSCSMDFNPKFHLPSGTAIALNDSKLASVDTRAVGNVLADYFASGATANSYYYDFTSGGNPGNYKTFVWGFDDACLDLPQFWEFFPKSDQASPRPFLGMDGRYQGPATTTDPEVMFLRDHALVNTYAETAPLAYLSEVRPSFQVGVDRILVRTVTHPFAKTPVAPPTGTTPDDLALRPPKGSDDLRSSWGCLLISSDGFGVMTGHEAGGLSPFVRGEEAVAKSTTEYLIVTSIGGLQSRSKALRLDQQVILGFEPTVRSAKKLTGFLREDGRFAGRYGKVVLLWTREPTDLEEERVTGCLPFVRQK